MAYYEHMQQIELYSLKSNPWMRISAPEYCLNYSPSLNNYINGFYYWRAKGFTSSNRILSLDMVNENFSSLPLPLVPKSRELKNLGIRPNKGPVHILTYVESLVPISERSEEEEAIICLPPGDAPNRYYG
ncbi:hypothetical protein Gohar_026718 [Gossypium harknessii]|uniref:F-box associated beta-propeller type 1 domain-containing protein n=1 Tax=Gossypium harknessii TaxID=34285 RepID=A0A7J9HSE0_9ROSI|nr:hypothetical protein [Gossypium harknessii]